MSAPSARDLQALKRLLAVIEREYQVLMRRLTKSGPGHYAIARFDALVTLREVCRKELERWAPTHDVRIDALNGRLAKIGGSLDSLGGSVEEFASRHVRMSRTRARTQVLVAQFKDAAVLPDAPRTSSHNDSSQTADDGNALSRRAQSGAKSELYASDDDVLLLSGRFARRRAAKPR